MCACQPRCFSFTIRPANTNFLSRVFKSINSRAFNGSHYFTPHAVSENRKEQWTVGVEALALILSFIPGAHYASCPLLVVAMAPWIIPDLRMKRVFEEARREE